MSRVTLNKSNHVYLVDGKPADLSVTSWIGQFHPDFDEDAVLDKLNLKDHERAKMAYLWNKSAVDGTFVHDILELYVQRVYVKGGEFAYFNGGAINDESINAAIAAGIKNIDLLMDKLQYTPDRYELLPEYKSYFTVKSGKVVAGSIDLLILDHDKKQFIIIDYKTSKKIDGTAYNEKFFKPIEHVHNSKINRYSLQMEAYAYMVEQEYPEYALRLKSLLHIPLTFAGKSKWIKGRDLRKELELLIANS